MCLIGIKTVIVIEGYEYTAPIPYANRTRVDTYFLIGLIGNWKMS
jgi:hypothetical protein